MGIWDGIKSAFGAGEEKKLDIGQRTSMMLPKFLDTRVRLRTDRHSSFHPENLTVEFLRELLDEGNPYRPASGEYLRKWDMRSNLPAELKEARNSANIAIKQRLEELQAKLDAEARALGSAIASKILSMNSSRVEKFLEIAYRRVAIPDEYGDEKPSAFDDELYRFLKKLSETENELQRESNSTFMDRKRFTARKILEYARFSPISSAIAKELQDRFSQYYQERKTKGAGSDSTAIQGMTGTEFEIHLAGLLRSAGVTDVSFTQATGDQGADLLFSWHERKFVIQAKRYSSTVGNKAVQEAHAAKGFFGCDLAWVVTNSRFTPSAKTLAKELGVVLVDGDNLSQFDSFVRQQLSI